MKSSILTLAASKPWTLKLNSTRRMSLLEQIHTLADLKNLSLQDRESLAAEIRERIIRTTARNGGHVGPNLGVVELTIALHRVFNTPEDRLVFDVSHQAYVHKLLTGAMEARSINCAMTMASADS